MPEARTHDTEVLVLGAGLTGSCVALALAAAGHHVTILDRAGSALSGASGNTEAKIHLGYVYALDEGLATQRRMLTGALTFAPLLDRWLGAQPWEALRTTRTRYAVMPDSMLDADELESRYSRIGDALADVREYVEEVVGAPGTYLGQPLSGRVTRTAGDGSGPIVGGEPVETTFETEEVGIDPDRLSDVIRAGLARWEIDLRSRTEVREARRDGDGFAVAVTEADGATAWWRAQVVVNCLWEDRVRVDETVGVESPVDHWLYRVKHLVIAKLRPGLEAPTMNMVQGPYGSIINWAGSRACLSWYPVARTQLQKIARTEASESAMRTSKAPERIVETTLARMTELFPVLEGAKVVDVRGGVLVAPGASDIDDMASGLHVRTNPAVHAHDGWWTIDTGKYTLAPLLAFVASRQVDAALHG